tara:strand:+ start:312 stop:1139 length:828 start_codon:yes stop_codon:yes gene_type:complete
MISNQIKFQKKDFSKIINSLKINGVAIVESFYDKDLIDNARSVILDLFLKDSANKYSIKKWSHPNEDGQQIIAYQKFLESKTNSIFKKLFQNSFLKDISEEYYFPNTFEFNEKLRFTYLKSSNKFLTDWHYDPSQSLKFWVYLTDTDETNGALSIAPGTQFLGRLMSENNILKGSSIKNMKTSISDDNILLKNRISLNASCKDLIIFDPDTFHQGGLIEKGKERIVAYSYTFPLPKKKDISVFSPGFLLKSFLNINKYIKKYPKRILGKNSYFEL